MFVSQLLQEKRCADEYLHCLIPRCGDLKKTYFPIILVCQNFMKASKLSAVRQERPYEGMDNGRSKR